MATDLFGLEVGEPGAAMDMPTREPLVLDATPRVRGKHYVEPRGYAAGPGTGPEGKTCKDCAYYTYLWSRSGKSYPKCGLAERRWTSGRGSDILAKAPACSMFKAKE